MLPTAMRRLVCLGLWSVLAWAAVGCSQDAGEVCQVDRDCADGLECIRATGSSRGTCLGPDDIDAGALGGAGGAGGLGGLGGAGGSTDAATSDDDASAADAAKGSDGDAGGA